MSARPPATEPLNAMRVPSDDQLGWVASNSVEVAPWALPARTAIVKARAAMASLRMAGQYARVVRPGLAVCKHPRRHEPTQAGPLRGPVEREPEERGRAAQHEPERRAARPVGPAGQPGQARPPARGTGHAPPPGPHRSP